MSVEARLLFAKLERENADADPAVWDKLRTQVEAKASVLEDASPARHRLLMSEFEKSRARALRRRDDRALLAELAAGNAGLGRVRPDGLEEWHVAAGGASAMILLPDADAETAGVTEAREALLAGHCPSCKRTPEADGGVIFVRHTKRCPAYKLLGQ